jgi:diacylglycerol kinase family enzyme
MYYYVLESPQTRSARQIYQKLRDILTNLGIGGEMVVSSPARSPVELAVMGLQRGYSTIVAVGSDSVVEGVASTIIGRAVLGIIPINASAEVVDLAGTNNLREAADSLKARRLITTSCVVVNEERPIFLNATLQTDKIAKVSLVLDNRLRAFAYFNRLVVTRDLEIIIESQHQSETRKVLGLFTVGGETVKSESLFHAKSVRLVTDPELPLTVAGETIAATPLQLKLLPESLKVITRRGTMS